MKIIELFRAIASKLHNYFMINRKHNVQVGLNPSICGGVDIYGKGQLIIGDNVRINSGKWCNPIGGDSRMLFVIEDGAVVSLGRNVAISNSAIVSRKKIIIGDNVMIGGSCKIYDTDFHSIDFHNRMQKPDTDVKTEEIQIEQGVFIGANSIILKGVHIGKCSVIGAGSVVTKNIPEYEIWAGNPAKYIRKIEVENGT